jgi:enoyl-CoA hydratase/3-hydroxyacyl-CoA dehydrogenase
MSSIRKIAVIGAGNMGSGIAQKIAQEGIAVVMVDTQQAFVDRGLATIGVILAQGVERKLFKTGQAADILARIAATTDLGAVADADIVIEAVFEDRNVKAKLFEDLDRICGPATILATNTSSFYVAEFAARTGRPDRFVGMHYFYHPAKNRLLEVIPHAGTSAATMDKTLLAAKLHGKTAIVVKDAPGFCVNRFFVPFLNEAARILAEGLADIATIEAAAKQAFGIGMGPFELMNVTGIPITVHASATLADQLGPFYATSPNIIAQVENGRPWDVSGHADPAKTPAVADRLLGVTLGVAAALVDEGVASMEDTDRGAKIGLRWARGPFEIINRLGIDQAVKRVEAVAAAHPDFKVAAMLKRQQAGGKPFAFSCVDLAVKGPVAWITINRPEAMNAINSAVVAQLDQRLTEAQAHSAVKVIVIQGAGKAFVAGADIRFFVKNIQDNRIPDIVDFTRQGHDVLLRLENSPKPTIALLDGLSLGGGTEMALACQAIVATPAGSMGLPETGIGIYPGLGGMLRLSRMVGPDLAKYYVFTGAPLSARDAHDLGLVAALVEPGQVPEAIAALIDAPLPDKYRRRVLPAKFKALAAACTPANIARLYQGQALADVDPEIAARFAKTVGFKAPLAIRTAAELIDRQQGKPMAEAIALELDRLAAIFATADALEGLSSLGKRRPVFKGA